MLGESMGKHEKPDVAVVSGKRQVVIPLGKEEAWHGSKEVSFACLIHLSVGPLGFSCPSYVVDQRPLLMI